MSCVERTHLRVLLFIVVEELCVVKRRIRRIASTPPPPQENAGRWSLVRRRACVIVLVMEVDFACVAYCV